jgi:hypothetical protein
MNILRLNVAAVNRIGHLHANSVMVCMRTAKIETKVRLLCELCHHYVILVGGGRLADKRDYGLCVSLAYPAAASTAEARSCAVRAT